MPSLSLVMIVKNEERRLLNCLESVRDIAEELLVGDTGSTDHTRAIAEEAGARVIEIPWQDDFAAARNAVLGEAAGDWLLHLDADEMLDADGAAHIRHLVDQDGFGADAVEVMLANYCDEPRAWRWTPVRGTGPFAEKYSGYIPVPLLRLFRNGKGFHYRERVHENITQSVIELGGTALQRHDILIHHYGYQSEGERREEKPDLYLRLAREKRDAHPRDSKALMDLAEQAIACGETAEAEVAARTVLESEPQHVAACMTVANICLNRGDLEAAREVLQRIEALPEVPPQAHVGLAAIDYRTGRLHQAVSRLERLLERHPDALLARLYLARAYDRFGAPDRAIRQLKVAQESAPTVQEFRDRVEALNGRRSAEEYFQNGLSQEALETLVDALRKDPEDPLIHNDLGVVLHSMGDRDRARASFQRALQLAPGLPEAEENLRKL